MTKKRIAVSTDYDPVNPPHYQRGPEVAIYTCNTYGHPMKLLRSTIQRAGKLWIAIHCIDIVAAMPDYCLAQAVRYIWRVAWGGKVGEDDKVDIQKAVWYLTHWLESYEPPLNTACVAYDKDKPEVDISIQHCYTD